MPKKPDTFSVIYRQGGAKRCKWVRINEAYETRAVAQAMVNKLERMGYGAYLRYTDQLDRIGLPIGWDGSTSALDWVHTGNGWFRHDPGAATMNPEYDPHIDTSEEALAFEESQPVD